MRSNESNPYYKRTNDPKTDAFLQIAENVQKNWHGHPGKPVYLHYLNRRKSGTQGIGINPQAKPWNYRRIVISFLMILDRSTRTISWQRLANKCGNTLGETWPPYVRPSRIGRVLSTNTYKSKKLLR